MTKTFKSYPIKTLAAFLLIIAGILLSIEAWSDERDGNTDTVIGLTVFFIGVFIFIKVYAGNWFKDL